MVLSMWDVAVNKVNIAPDLTELTGEWGVEDVHLIKRQLQLTASRRP